MDFYATLLGAKTVESIRVVANVGGAILSDPLQGNRQNDLFLYGVSLARALTQKAELVGEVNGRVSTRSGEAFPGTETRGLLKLGGRFTQGPLRLDAGIFFGLTSVDPTVDSRRLHLRFQRVQGAVETADRSDLDAAAIFGPAQLVPTIDAARSSAASPGSPSAPSGVRRSTASASVTTISFRAHARARRRSPASPSPDESATPAAPPPARARCETASRTPR